MTALVDWRYKHGFSKTRIYGVWRSMISRCHRESDKNFRHYGGRGIFVCQQWRSDFSIFLRDMGLPPPRHSLERIDNGLGYQPGNVRWASQREQTRNTRRNVLVTVNGLHLCFKDGCVAAGINYRTARSRVMQGWDPQRAVIEPIDERKRNGLWRR